MNAPPASTGEEGASEEGEMNEGRQASEAETDTLPDDTGRCRLLVSRREEAGRKKGGGERGRERERGTGGGRGGRGGTGGRERGVVVSSSLLWTPRDGTARLHERERESRQAACRSAQTDRRCVCASVRA